MMTKAAVLDGLKMYNDKIKDKLDGGSVRLSKKSSTVEGTMWYTIDEDLYWSLYICMNGARVEIAYGQLKNRS